MNALDKAALGHSFASASGSSKCWNNRISIGGRFNTSFINFTDEVAAGDGKLSRLSRGAALLTFGADISKTVSARITLPTVAFDHMTNASNTVNGTAVTKPAEDLSTAPQTEAFITYRDSSSNLWVKAGQFFLDHGSYTDTTADFPSIDQMISQYNTQAVEVGMLQEDMGLNAHVGLYSNLISEKVKMLKAST
jgi:hypothetical protein